MLHMISSKNDSEFDLEPLLVLAPTHTPPRLFKFERPIPRGADPVQCWCTRRAPIWEH
jgi:hypothetical protein